MAKRNPPVRQLLPRAERQEDILRNAARAFAEKGFAATSMEDVAAASGVTKLIVYRHFDSKEDLYRAVLGRASQRLAEEFVAEVAQGKGEGAGVRVMLRVAREDPAGFELLWRHAPREAPFEAYAAEARAGALCATELLLGPVLDDPVLRQVGAQTLVGTISESVLHWLENGDPGRDAEFCDLVSSGVRGMVGAWARRRK